MKIICIGRNYTEHAKELGNQIPTEPVLFIKPETAFNSSNCFELPKFSQDVHFELELALKITKKGKNICPTEATSYFDEIGLGIDFTARDIQSKLKQKGLPWEKAKAFDNSAFISEFVPIKSLSNPNEITFELFQNNQLKQSGNSKHMLFNFTDIIAHTSTYFSLEIGDILFTGTPKGVGQVYSGDILEGKLEGKSLFKLNVK